MTMGPFGGLLWAGAFALGRGGAATKLRALSDPRAFVGGGPPPAKGARFKGVNFDMGFA